MLFSVLFLSVVGTGLSMFVGHCVVVRRLFRVHSGYQIWQHSSSLHWHIGNGVQECHETIPPNDKEKYTSPSEMISYSHQLIVHCSHLVRMLFDSCIGICCCYEFDTVMFITLVFDKLYSPHGSNTSVYGNKIYRINTYSYRPYQGRERERKKEKLGLKRKHFTFEFNSACK